MAVSLPDTEDLDVFSHDATDIYTEEQKAQAVQQAGDLFYIATGITEDSEEEAIARIVTWGLLDMAWKLLISTENKTESFSPYSSERIGSYSYSKMTQAVNEGVTTGVEWFDAAVKLVLALSDDGAAVWLATEQVFTTPYTTDLTTSLEILPDWYGS